MRNLLKSLWLFFLDFIETIVIALAIFVVVYRFLFQPHQVRGNSMFDNFHDGEYLLTDKIDYRFPAYAQINFFAFIIADIQILKKNISNIFHIAGY